MTRSLVLGAGVTVDAGGNKLTNLADGVAASDAATVGQLPAGGSIDVTDGVTTVSPATEIDFTAGAVVTDLGGGVAGVAINPAGSGIAFDTSPQSGGFLDITTTGQDGSGYGVHISDTGSPNGVKIESANEIELAAPASEVRLSSINTILEVGGSAGGLNAIQLTIESGGTFAVYDHNGTRMIETTDGGMGGDVIGLYGATAVPQPSAITSPTGGATVDAEARTAIDSILAVIGAAAGGIGITA